MDEVPEHRLLTFETNHLVESFSPLEFVQDRTDKYKRHFEESTVPLLINQIVGGCDSKK
jgi:hypothetical protein